MGGIPRHAAWGDPWRPLGTFTLIKGDTTEFPGQPPEKQQALMKQWVAMGATDVQVAVGNGDTSNGRRRYDGFGDMESLRTLFAYCAHTRMRPWLAMVQGSRASWDWFNLTHGRQPAEPPRVQTLEEGRLIDGYGNAWAAAHLGEWADRANVMWREELARAGTADGAPKLGFVEGWELDESYGEYPRDYKGPREYIGWAAAQETWGRILHEHGFVVAIHCLTDTFHPDPATDMQDFGREFGGVAYYRGGGLNTHGRNYISFIFMQTAADDDRPMDEQVAVIAHVVGLVRGYLRPDGGQLLVTATEYAQEGSPNPARAGRLGQKMMAAGSAGAMGGF